MLHGTARPNAISWFLFTLLQTIAVVAQFAAGASWSVILLIAMTGVTGTVTVLALSGYGYRKYGLIDWTCFALALIAITFWLLTDEPVTAIAFAILADALAVTPTIVKVYREPRSESVTGWFMVFIASILAGVSSTQIDLANLMYPVYLVIVTGIVTSLAFFGQRLKPKPIV